MWDDDVIQNSESRLEQVRQHVRNLNESHDEATREEALTSVDATRHDMEELITNQIYDKLAILLNNTRKKYWYTERSIDL